MLAVLDTLRFILRHPLNRGRALATLARFVRWQLGSRLLPGPVAVPFVGETRLLVRPGMTGATGNVYCGLHEFEEMAFVLHALRRGDLFVDVGANVGSYTVLAAGACGASVLAVEPATAAFGHLLDNIRLNGLEELVDARQLALASSNGRLPFSTGMDTLNHVLSEAEAAGAPAVEVPAATLDSLVGELCPALVKIDVEGYESEVLKGGARVLGSGGLSAVLLETNSSGRRYGVEDRDLHGALLGWGFTPCSYQPFARSLNPMRDDRSARENTLYVRDCEGVRERVRGAPKHRVMGREL